MLTLNVEAISLITCLIIIYQVFEVLHLISAIVDLVSACNPTLSKNLDSELDQIILLLGRDYL